MLIKHLVKKKVFLNWIELGYNEGLLWWISGLHKRTAIGKPTDLQAAWRRSSQAAALGVFLLSQPPRPNPLHNSQRRGRLFVIMIFNNTRPARHVCPEHVCLCLHCHPPRGVHPLTQVGARRLLSTLLATWSSASFTLMISSF